MPDLRALPPTLATGRFREKLQQSGSDGIRLSHFPRKSLASPEELALAGSPREGERGRGAAWPPQFSRLQIRKDGAQTTLLGRSYNQLPVSEEERNHLPPPKSVVATSGERKGGESNIIGNVLSTKIKKKLHA